MAFRPESIRGGSGDGLPGQIDYRLARNAVLSEFRRGRLARHEVCDAHPELIRAARNVGTPSEQLCPVCEEVNVVFLTYAFGTRLPPQGKIITKATELASATRTAGEAACYVVEVCPDCSWNHLARTFVATKATRRRSSAR